MEGMEALRFLCMQVEGGGVFSQAPRIFASLWSQVMLQLHVTATLRSSKQKPLAGHRLCSITFL